MKEFELRHGGKFERKFSFGHMLVAGFIGAVIGIFTLSFVQRDKPAETNPQQSIIPSVNTHKSLNSRWSSERFHVFGRETWMLYDTETQTQYIVDAPSSLHRPERLCWAAVKL